MKQNSSTQVEPIMSSHTFGNTPVMGSTGNSREIEGINRVHHLNFLNNNLPDKCANLIIADPPYFEVKGDFDFIWESFDDYLQDVEKWAKECKRLLADNGTLFWYGDRKNIAYAQVILDNYFQFQNHIYWQKAEKCQMEMFDTLRSFYCRGYERILMYSNEDNFSDYERVIYGLKDYTQYMNEVKLTTNINEKELNKTFGYVAGCNWWFSKKQPRMISEKDYEKLKRLHPEFYKSYEELLIDYKINLAHFDSVRRPFNNFLKLSDHWFFTNDASVSKYEHETVKPEEMTRAMILTCSRPNDLVLAPFAGSGTECAMAVKEGRKTIGFEITEKHAKMSNERVQNILRQPSLFVGS